MEQPRLNAGEWACSHTCALFLRAPRRSKFQIYTAVTLGLEGEEGGKVSARLWNAVDGQLKKEVGPGVDCLLTRVKSRCVCASTSAFVRGACTSEQPRRVFSTGVAELS